MGGAVDFWDHPYYKHIKTLTTVVGQWPYQSMRELIMYRFLVLILVSVQVIPQILAFWKYRHDMSIILDSISPFIVDAVFTVKLVNYWWHFRRFAHLLDQIREHWSIFPHNNGLHMLHYHTELGRKFSIVYLMAVYLGASIFFTEPLQERVMYTLMYPNITLPKKFSMPMDFGPIDLDKWYYPLLLGSGCCILIIMTVLISCDLLLFVSTEHACGMFRGLGYAIEHLPPYDKSEKGDYSFEYMRSCAIIHRRLIDFAELIRDIYLWSFFGVIGLNMVIMSVTGVQVVINLGAMEKILQYIVFVSLQMVHLFVECFAAQRLMDATFELKETLTNAKWYNASKKTQRLIPMMLIRTQTPIVLTAGKIMVMNMDTFAVIVKTAASYFTVVLAMQ